MTNGEPLNLLSHEHFGKLAQSPTWATNGICDGMHMPLRFVTNLKRWEGLALWQIVKLTRVVRVRSSDWNSLGNAEVIPISF
jgi:hypothetical protein